MADPTRPIIPEGEGSTNPNNQNINSIHDPVSSIADILERPDLSSKDKEYLKSVARNRFLHRRIMAYLSLGAIMALFITIIFGIWIDGSNTCVPNWGVTKCPEGILNVINNNRTVVEWISGFLTSIVGLYYGTSALRPKS